MPGRDAFKNSLCSNSGAILSTTLQAEQRALSLKAASLTTLSDGPMCPERF
jgi:hypothetical protein